MGADRPRKAGGAHPAAHGPVVPDKGEVMRVSKPLTLALGAALAVLSSCGLAGDDVAATSAAASARALETSNAGGDRFATVMTRNLYVGVDLSRAFGLEGLDFIAETTAMWATVVKNDFPARAQAIADEIALALPDVIGLQEVYTWRIQEDGDFLAGNPLPAETVVYDYLQLLQDALAERGLVYEVAAKRELTDLEAPIFKAPPTPGGFETSDLRLTDHSVILVRGGTVTANPREGVYETFLPAPLAGGTVAIARGFTGVDVKLEGAWFTFVSTHLEAYHPGVRTGQAFELAAALAGVEGRLVVVGDMNSRPDGSDVDGGAAYQLLRQACFADAWAELTGELGYTSGWDEDLTLTEDPDTGEPLELYERIDLVLLRGGLVPVSASVVGDEPSDRLGGLWPSDHAGVVATLRLANPHVFAGCE